MRFATSQHASIRVWRGGEKRIARLNVFIEMRRLLQSKLRELQMKPPKYARRTASAA